MSNFSLKTNIEKFKPNELIFASEFYNKKIKNKMSEEAYYKSLERMCKNNELMKISKGTYHIPKLSKYGIVPISEDEIIKTFTDKEKGTVVGYKLYNQLNLTTQISKNTTVYNSFIDGQTKQVENVKIFKCNLKFTPKVVNIIRLLEVLQNFESIEDINRSSFVSFAENSALNFDYKTFCKIIEKVKYKTSTISFLKNVLDFYDIENNLGEHLSSLSKYKHPRMEEIYETSRI